jgi:hypothetical protein
MCEIKSKIVMAKAAFSKKKTSPTNSTFFTMKLVLNLQRELVKCYIWSVALCGAGTGTLREVDRKYLGSFEVWC